MELISANRLAAVEGRIGHSAVIPSPLPVCAWTRCHWTVYLGKLEFSICKCTHAHTLLGLCKNRWAQCVSINPHGCMFDQGRE
ncbi:hypothetical protein FQN60_003715 [Etheostoma spectabile]|uniref:Uncharacterized protein n=1 Tax=Etheostoma spectabile TaxID=54343 RepID=A0A5J5D0A0_9PERO|nr:hypothetical protein FQN60_003715 [Etheostoma spectabile]